MLELTSYGKSTIRLDVIDYYYQDGDVFDLDKTPGLNIAFGITHYDTNLEPIDDLDYGEVVAYAKGGNDLSGDIYEKIALRPCTYEELGLDKRGEISETAKFYPAHANSINWLEFYWKKLQCYDRQVDIHGNFDTANTTQIHFLMERCDPEKRSTCKSDEEFSNFTNNLYYIHFHNSVRFVQTGFGE